MNTTPESGAPQTDDISQKQGNVEGAAPLPTLLKLTKILVPTDFSETSRKALQYAIAFAKQFGAKITLLHVIEPPPESEERIYAETSLEEVMRPVREQLETLATSAIESKLLDTTLVRVGVPFVIITDLAGELEIDLVIVTTHGYTGLKHVFLGSTAERIVRHAPCPVLVVREREHEFVQV
ncbi:MAG TPA: universal stress protein [Chthoniobacterales bacterium]